MFLILSLSAVTVLGGSEMVVNMPKSNNWEIGMTMDLNFVKAQSPFTADSFEVFQKEWEEKKENDDYDTFGTFEMTSRLVQSQQDKLEAIGVEGSLEASFAMFSGDAHISFAKENVDSALDVSLIVKAHAYGQKGQMSISDTNKLELKDNVPETLDEFKDHYGSYMIVGFEYGGEIMYTSTHTVRREDDKLAVAGALSMSYSKALFSVSGSVEGTYDATALSSAYDFEWSDLIRPNLDSETVTQLLTDLRSLSQGNAESLDFQSLSANAQSLLSGDRLDPIKAVLVPLDTVGAVHDMFGTQTSEDTASFMKFLNEVFLGVEALEKQLDIVMDGYANKKQDIPDEVYDWKDILNRLREEMVLLNTRQEILEYAASYNERGVLDRNEEIDLETTFLEVHSGEILAKQFDEEVMAPYDTMIVVNTPSLDYTYIYQGCVSGHNMVKRAGLSEDDCAKLCDKEPECLAFEYGVEHGGPSTVYDAKDCQLQSSADYSGCKGWYHNLDLYVKRFEYDGFDGPACVTGNNLKKYKSKSLEECKSLCNAEPQCLAIEYGVNHGGEYKKISPRDCRLQSSANPDGCRGDYYNLDLYVKRLYNSVTDAAASQNVDSSDAASGSNGAPQAINDDFIPMVVGAAIGALLIALVLAISMVLAKRKSSGTKRATKTTTKIAIPEMSCSFNIEAAGSSGNGTGMQ